MLALSIGGWQQASASEAPAEHQVTRRLLLRAALSQKDNVSDGSHEVVIRIYNVEGALLHEEQFETDILNGSFDVMVGSHDPLDTYFKRGEYSITLSIDGNEEHPAGDCLRTALLFNEDGMSLLMQDREEVAMPAIDPNYSLVTSAYAERIARKSGLLKEPVYTMPTTFLPPHSHLAGLQMEMALAAPAVPTMDYYEMAKYGRINVEYNNFARFDGAMVGVAAQALHVAHHILLYAAGFTTDINGDGMFMLTGGLAHYQSGNKRSEEFVNAPFIRMKFHSSDDVIFLYSELETTMHFRQYISSTMGLGIRLTPGVKMIGGLHHTEFVQPTEHGIRNVNGFHGILSWGL